MNSDRAPNLEGLRHAFPYPQSGHGATTVLGRELQQQIVTDGPICFSEFMATCLYHPVHGYYSRPNRATVSKEGDFMTSVSVGPVFGALLARRLFHFWKKNGSPSGFALFEIGAHNGSLACDILAAADQLSTSFASALHYHIIEPLEAQRSALQDRLGQKATILASPPPQSAPFGALIANEVLDALPLPILTFSNDQWHKVLVDFDRAKEDFNWTLEPAPLEIPGTFPEGYVTEGTPNLADFFAPLSSLFEKGLMTFIDYGLDQNSLYHPTRSVGTLRCYRNHSMKSHPLDHPGEQDLTADVNFTAVEDAARSHGLESLRILDQSRFLTHCAKEWLVSGNPPTPSELRQFQTLVHPSQFGTRFYALELSKGHPDGELP
ncbi:MAG: class I SAM-dependent methyltransferase [Verrucomicrobiaceae bacterium]